MSFNVRRRKRGPILSTTNNDWNIVSQETNQLERNWKVFGFASLWILMLFIDIYYVIPLVQRGIIFSTSTQEKCKIIGFTENDCKYECECMYTVDANGDHQRYCQRCDGTAYTYQAVAESKCGSDFKLIQTKHEQICPDIEYEIGDMITCYVPNCHYKTFTYHHHYKIMFEVGLLFLIFTSIIIFIPYHVCTQHRKKKLVLTL